jgi:hypothetical protein
MILIDNKIISDDVVEKQFVCNLDACKGACCWEGDSGAPLEKAELAILEEIYPKVKPFLTQKGIEVIEQEGVYTYYKREEEYGTPLIDNAACAYLTYDGGIAKCGIEKAQEAGVIDYKKPISCHLYPIRITSNETFDAVNYDKWDICTAACSLGEKLEMPVYQFLKGALIRKYGEEFYEALDAAANFEEEK